MAHLASSKQKESGGQLSAMEKNVEKLSENLVRVKTQVDNKRDSLKEEEEALNGHKKSLSEVINNSFSHLALSPLFHLTNSHLLFQLASSLKTKEATFAKTEEAFQALKEAYDSKVEEIKKKEDLLAALSTGFSSSESEKGFVEQLQDAKNEASRIASETEQAKLKLTHLQPELKTLQPKAKKLEKDNQALEKELAENLKAAQILEVSFFLILLLFWLITSTLFFFFRSAIQLISTSQLERTGKTEF